MIYEIGFLAQMFFIYTNILQKINKIKIKHLDLICVCLRVLLFLLFSALKSVFSVFYDSFDVLILKINK
jgi:hypothetical protein